MVAGKLRILIMLSLWPLRHGLGTHATTECQVLFDGRIAQNVEPADFDRNTSIYDHQFVHGESDLAFYVLLERNSLNISFQIKHGQR